MYTGRSTYSIYGTFTILSTGISLITSCITGTSTYTSLSSGASLYYYVWLVYSRTCWSSRTASLALSWASWACSLNVFLSTSYIANYGESRYTIFSTIFSTSIGFSMYYVTGFSTYSILGTYTIFSTILSYGTSLIISIGLSIIRLIY